MRFSDNESRCCPSVLADRCKLYAGGSLPVAGVWAREVAALVGVSLPLVPMKHAYVVTEGLKGVRGLPNVRDHDFATYFRVQGESLCMGGYEPNPILLDKVTSLVLSLRRLLFYRSLRLQLSRQLPTVSKSDIIYTKHPKILLYFSIQRYNRYTQI